MPLLPCSRRRFLQLSAGAALGHGAFTQQPSLAHESVAKLERTRILADAADALITPIHPITEFAAPHSPPDQFFSEFEPDIHSAGTRSAPALFRAQADALRALSNTVATLSAAFLLTADVRYANRAALHLHASLLDPKTRLSPSFDQSGCAPGTHTPTPAGVVDLVPLAELARACTFFVDSEALPAEDWSALHTWFASAQTWLTSNRQALIARDTKDHRASAWLLVASAFARFLQDDNQLEACRKLFRKPTLRNQIRSDGLFPQEVATPNPYRNTLFNFDLLCGACQLLSSQFDLLWSYELIDGVGLRIVAAYLFPLIAHPERWEYPADAIAFRDLPGRRPGLLFAGRAYDRPEYVEVWQQSPAGPLTGPIAASFPIREPLLWTARAPHGL